MTTSTLNERSLPEASSKSPTEADRHARASSIVEQHLDSVWRTLRRLGVPPNDLDDAVQQVFMTLSRRVDQVEAEKTRSFLLGVAIRVAADERGRRRRHPEDATELGKIERSVVPPPSPEDLLDEKRRLEVLDRLIQRMPAELASVFVLFELEQLTMLEIARTLALPAGTVASRLRRARERFEILCAALENGNE